MGQIKAIVRKPNNAISQVLCRYAEKMWLIISLSGTKLHDANSFKQQLFGRPLLNAYNNYFFIKKDICCYCQ